MLTYSKLNLLLGCFNQSVFSDAKMNIGLLKLYFRQESYNKPNSLQEKLLGVLEDYKFQDITESLFISVFQSDGKSDNEVVELVNKVKEYKTYTSSQAEVFRNDLREVCYQAYLTQAKRLYPEDPVRFTEYLRNFSYKTNVSNSLIIKNFRDLDITDLSKMYSGEGFKSSFKFINDSYTCGGYVPGQIVNICGAPGSGKSLFIENEVVNFTKQGKRTHLFIAGDLNELDLASRMTCMMAQKPRRVIESDINNYWEMYRDKFGDLVGVTIVPAGKISARDYVDFMLDHKDEFDVLVLDYDANLARSHSNSMYDEFGQIYDSLTELSRAGKLVLVATQPKLSYYREEEIPMEGLSDSSKKQQIVDMIITIGKRYESKMRMGKMTIVKNRRGDLGQAMWIGSNEGLFYECSNMLYARFRNLEEYRGLYSYEDLKSMDVLTEAFDGDGNDDVLSNIGTKV